MSNVVIYSFVVLHLLYPDCHKSPQCLVAIGLLFFYIYVIFLQILDRFVPGAKSAHAILSPVDYLIH